jgi:hypothetical protein
VGRQASPPHRPNPDGPVRYPLKFVIGPSPNQVTARPVPVAPLTCAHLRLKAEWHLIQAKKDSFPETFGTDPTDITLLTYILPFNPDAGEMIRVVARIPR